MSQTLSPTLDLQADFGAPDPALWRSLTEKVLGGVPFDKKLVVKTPEGIPVQPIYGPDALEALDLADTMPGKFPYVRGTKAEGYRSGAWKICQRLPYTTAEEFNAAAKRDLSRGQDALMLDGDLSAAQLDAALKDLDLSGVAVHLDAGADALQAVETLFARPDAPAEGSVLFDPVAMLATQGVLPMTLEQAWDRLAEGVKTVDTHAPAFKSVSVDVTWCGNAGGHAVWDLAIMLASAAESFRALEERGVSPNLAGEKALVRFSVGTDFFMEAAKFRAARGLWAHFVKACGGGEDAAKLTQYARTSIWEQSALDPYVNLLRATSEAFSAVIGGVDGLTVDPFDAVAGPPNEFSRRIARNIQLVLRDEAHLTEVVDPAGGSWLVETLTKELSEKAWALFQDIERKGGLIAMLGDGSLREELLKSAEEKKLKLARRQAVKVGVNQYANLDETPLRPVNAAAAESAEAADHQVTRAVPVKADRLTSGYERLRENMAAYVAANGSAPKIFMAQMGPVKQHKLRSDFSVEFLKPSGFAIVAEGSYADAESAAAAAVAAGAAATVICSTDDTYPDLVPAFANAVKAANPKIQVLVAGLLPDHVEAFKAAGVDEFIHLRANNLELLSDLQALTGVAQ